MIKENYLKSIRKLLNLKQEDITNGQITRNTISHIENQKVSLTEKTIKLILNTINEYVRQANHFIELDYDDLFTAERFENKLIAEDMYKNLELLCHIENANLDLAINEINLLIAKWDFPIIKLKLYDLLGEYFYKKNDYNTSQYYHNQAVSAAYRTESLNNIGQAILKLMRADIMANSTRNSLELSKQLLSRKSELESSTYQALLFNAALLLEKNNNYDEALINLNEIENASDELGSEQLLDVLLLKAICHDALNNFEESLGVYNHLLSLIVHTEDYGTKANIHCNTLTLYIKQNSKSKVSSTIKTLDDLLPLVDEKNKYLPGIYLELARAYKYLKNYDMAINYFKKSIKSAIKLNEYSNLSDALADYIKTNELVESSISHSTTLLILELLSSKKINSDDDTIFYYLSYLEQKSAYKELHFFMNNIIKLRKEKI